MAINRGDIVSGALWLLGETTSYNDKTSDKYKNCDIQLNEIADDLLKDGELTFNAVTVELTRTGNTNSIGEYEYNLPPDFLTLVQFIKQDTSSSSRVESIYDINQRTRKQIFNLEGKYVYSREEKVFVVYKRRIGIEEFPEYTKRLLEKSLAFRMAQGYSAYADKFQQLNYDRAMERSDVFKVEGLAIKRRM
ncbi:MAG: hypothetical protein ACRC0V_03810 [Fusobacteriaceae bacterium]